MTKLLDWLKNEPVRVRLYAIIVAIAAYLALQGYVSATDVEFIGTMAVLILGVETTRNKVSPYRPKHKK